MAFAHLSSRLAALFACAMGCAVPSPAYADEPLRTQAAPPAKWRLSDARVIVSIERAFGVVGHWATSDAETVFGKFERERSGAQVHVLSSSGSIGDGDDSVNPSMLPRVGFDIQLSFGLTIGGGFGLLTTSGTETLTRDGETDPEIRFPDTTTVLLNPRAGFTLALGETVWFWPRVGYSYASTTASAGEAGSNTEKVGQLTVEPMVVLTPVSHVGIMMTPVIDIGVAGSVESEFTVVGLPPERTKGSFRLSSYGAAFGLSAAF